MIKSLYVKNILSISEVRIDFDHNGLCLLDGYNHDDNTANGSGKTAILNALAFGLYGDMPRSISASSFLRKGTKQGFAEVEVETQEGTWKVRRERPKKVSFWINGSPIIIEQEEFEKKIGLTYKQFLLVQYFSQSKKDRFATLNDTDKKDFLLKIVDMDKFAAARKIVTQELTTLNKQLLEKQSSVNSIDSKLEVMSDLISSESELKSKLKSLSTSAIDEAMTKLSSVEKPDTSKYQDIESKIKTKKQEFSEMRISIASLRKEHSLLNRQIKEYHDHDSVACPHCSEEIVVVSESLYKSSDIKAQNSKIDEFNASIKAQQSTLAKQINTLESKLLQEPDIVTLESKLREKQRKDAEEYLSAKNDIADLKTKKALIEQERKHLQTEIDTITSHKKSMQDLSAKKDSLLEEIETLSNDILVLDSLEGVFSTTGVQAYVTDSLVNMINHKATEYLDQIWLNASYKLLSYKENQSGEVKSKFSERICVAGHDMPIGSLSGGELCCISLVLDLAISEVVSTFCGVKISPILLDEPFDGMDTANREKAIELLSELSRTKQIWIIDHDSQAKTLFSKCVMIEKKDGISTLKESK